MFPRGLGGRRAHEMRAVVQKRNGLGDSKSHSRRPPPSVADKNVKISY